MGLATCLPPWLPQILRTRLKLSTTEWWSGNLHTALSGSQTFKPPVLPVVTDFILVFMKSPLKILFLSNRGLLPIKDGHSRRSFNILKGLGVNNDIYLLSLFESIDEVSLENLIKYENICCKVEFIKAPPKKISLMMILLLVRSIFSLDPYTVWRHYSKKFIERTEDILSKEDFDVVHCDILPIYYSIKNITNVFVSITDHDISYINCLGRAKSSSNIFLKIFLYYESFKLKILEKRVFENVNVGIMVSESDKNFIEAMCPRGNFLVVENGVDVNKFLPTQNEEEVNKLIWVGGFNYYPNEQAILYFLSKIYPLVKKRCNNITFDIIGDHFTNDMLKFSDKDSSINLMGFVDDPVPFMQKATIFIAPILIGGGTKLKLVEAMSTGKAIVTTAKGCEGIGGIHGIHYLVADNENNFAIETLKLLNNKILRKKLQVNAREYALQKFDNVKICNKLDRYYRNRCCLD